MSFAQAFFLAKLAKDIVPSVETVVISSRMEWDIDEDEVLGVRIKRSEHLTDEMPILLMKAPPGELSLIAKLFSAPQIVTMEKGAAEHFKRTIQNLEKVTEG